MMTKEICRITRERMQAALDEVSKKYGIIGFKVGSCTFGDSSATFKVEAAIIAADGKPTGKDADAFKREAPWFGFTADDLGAEFSDRTGKKFRIAGIASRRTKRPLIAVDEQGSRYQFQIGAVLRFMGRFENAKLYEERGYVTL